MKVRIIALALLVLGLAAGVPADARPGLYAAQPLADGTVHVAPNTGGPGGCCV
jgi:hypothetical protein